MVLEQVPPPYWSWLPEAAVMWLGYVGVIALVFLVLRFCWLAVREGVDRAGSLLVVWLGSALQDVIEMSPRRIWAVARLSVIEAIRRRAFVGLALFVAALALGSWFLRADARNPAELYQSTILWVINILVVVTALLISVFSLPADLKNKTIFTIVSKPVRPTELVLGRMIGFTIVGTIVLLTMSGLGYAFVVRSLDHTHEIRPDAFVVEELPAGATQAPVVEGHTETSSGHRHQVRADAEGRLVTDNVQGHWHAVAATDGSEGKRYMVGRPEGQFHARSPILGELRFRGPDGADKQKGVNVGEIWTYRSYVQGGSLAAAIWRFDGVTEERFPAGLRLDLNIQIFRTFKGDLEKGVLGAITIRNPRTGLASAPRTFVAKEFQIDRHLIPRSLVDEQGRPIDLFRDLVDDGQVEVWLTCLERGQFFGMARPDVYLLASEGSPLLNYFKGCLGMWLQMMLVIVFGVMWSTFLNGAVAMLATVGTIVFGFWNEFLREIAEGTVEGGGSFEALVRVLQHKNTRSELDSQLTTDVVHSLDSVVRFCMGVLSRLMPDFSALSDAAYVTQGYDVPGNLLAIQWTTALGYALPAFLLAFLFFKAREVAR